jgi:hypothetical protein
MENILSALERLADLSDEELDSLKADIVSTFKDLDKSETTADVVEQLSSLADAADAVKAEKSRRAAEVAELSAAREAAVSRLTEAEAAAEEPEVEDELDEDDKADEEEDDTVFAAKETEAEAPVVESAETELAAETVETAEPAAEAELAVTEPETVEAAPEAELAVEEPATEEPVVEAELSAETTEEVVETPAAEAELSVEEDEAVAESAETEAELAVEDTAAVETEAVTAAAEDESREDSEDTVTAAANAQELVAPADRRPVVESQATSVPVTITAAADIQGVPAGSELSSLREVADAIVKRLRTMGNSVRGADGERLSVATFTASYPEDRDLGNDIVSNSEKIQSVLDPAAITAAGGSCAPVATRYEIFSFNEETARPVRDALVTFGADRGGVRFVTPPTLEDLDGAVSTWTIDDDESAVDGSPTKPSLRVECGDEVVVYTDAIPLILTFGNMGARAYPELVARHTELGMVWHSRYAETRLLTRIGALSTAVTSAQELGAARDILVAVDQAAAGYRNRHRLSADTPLRVLLPEWVRAALRADMVKQAPGDGIEAAMNLADSTINSFFSSRDVNVSWFLDGEAGQIMGAQATGALNSFPENLVWYMFAEGTFLFLDGGQLDLGVVRDSQLNSTNDYQLFFETFEGVAKVGIESLRITTPVGLFGAYAASVDTTA